MIGAIFDVMLAVALPLLAWRTLAARDLFKAVVLFIAFGLLISLSWIRLDAPDIALAEAAIGAGITGAILLNTLGSLTSKGGSGRGEDEADTAEARGVGSSRLPVRPLVAGPVLALGAALVWAVASMPEPADDLAGAVRENLAGSGASNPVTAVLLNFRSYDTFLEVGVLLLAVVGVWSLALKTRGRRGSGASDGDNPLLVGLARLLAPVMVVVTAYLLYAGTSAPGGAFQAGAVLGALGVLLLLAGLLRPPDRGRLLRVGLAVGFGVFLVVACAMLASGRVLEYPPGWEYALILLVEAVLTVSIGLTLVALFVAVPPRSADEAGREEEEAP